MSSYIRPKQSFEIFQVDTFTQTPFTGNPAAVCLLKTAISDATMRMIALEMNMPETAFVLPLENQPVGQCNRFSLRWFMPSGEVVMCGHATLASAAVLFERFERTHDTIYFQTLSGEIPAHLSGDSLSISLPTEHFTVIPPIESLQRLLEVSHVQETLYHAQKKTLMLVLGGQADIHSVQPPYDALLKADIGYPIKKLIVSARCNNKYDIISRCFCPWIGIDEDSVSAASHVLIGTYWSKRLDKQDLFAYQASYRSGELYITIGTAHTVIRGHSVIVLSGELHQLPII